MLASGTPAKQIFGVTHGDIIELEEEADIIARQSIGGAFISGCELMTFLVLSTLVLLEQIWMFPLFCTHKSLNYLEEYKGNFSSNSINH